MARLQRERVTAEGDTDSVAQLLFTRAALRTSRKGDSSRTVETGAATVGSACVGALTRHTASDAES